MIAKNKISSARKTSVIPTKIYTYGAQNLDDKTKLIIDEQLRLANIYRNNLVAIERNRRTEYRTLRSSLSTKAQEFEKQNEELNQQIDTLRIQLQQIPDVELPGIGLLKSKRSNHPQAQILIKEIDLLKKKRAELGEDIKAEFARIEKEYFTANKSDLDQEKKRQYLLEIERRGNTRATELLTIFPDCLEDEEIAAEIARLMKETGPRVKAIINANLSNALQQSNSSDAIKQKDLIEQKAVDLGKQARKICGCFTGVYQAIETAVKRSFKTSLNQPKFTSFIGEGLVGIQLANKEVEDTKIQMTIERAMSLQDNRLSLVIPDAKKSEFVIASICLGNNIYIDIPFKMHRPFPTNTVIKWCYIKVSKIGYQTKYEIQFTVESPEFAVDKSDNLDRTVAINFGWRVKDNCDLRVATTWDGKNSEEIVLPAKLRSTIQFTESLLGFSDDHFNDAKKIFCKWLKNVELNEKILPYKFTTQTKGGVVPEREVKEQTYSERYKSAHSWHNHSRLISATFHLRRMYLKDSNKVSRIWNDWKSERFSKRLDLFDTFEALTNWFNRYTVDANESVALYLEWWRRKEEHLVNMARNLQKRVQLARREIYRVFTAKLKNQYKEVVVNKTNYSKLAQKPTPEKDVRTPQEEKANAVRQFCGISVFSGSLKEGFGKDKFIEENGKDITVKHYQCDGMAETVLPNIMVNCKKCLENYDQDVNAARHLWERRVKGSSGGVASDPQGSLATVMLLNRKGKSDLGSMTDNQ